MDGVAAASASAGASAKLTGRTPCPDAVDASESRRARSPSDADGDSAMSPIFDGVSGLLSRPERLHLFLPAAAAALRRGATAPALQAGAPGRAPGARALRKRTERTRLARQRAGRGPELHASLEW